jgi:hypothetical protein
MKIHKKYIFLFSLLVFLLIFIFVFLAIRHNNTQDALGVDMAQISETNDSAPSLNQEVIVNLGFVELDAQMLNNNNVVFGCGDSIQFIPRSIVPAEEVERSALEALLNEKNTSVETYYNSLAQSNLIISSFSIQNTIATVNLSGSLVLSGTCDSPRIKEQIIATLQQFPSIQTVKININGQDIDTALSAE